MQLLPQYTVHRTLNMNIEHWTLNIEHWKFADLSSSIWSCFWTSKTTFLHVLQNQVTTLMWVIIVIIILVLLMILVLKWPKSITWWKRVKKFGQFVKIKWKQKPERFIQSYPIIVRFPESRQRGNILIWIQCFLQNSITSVWKSSCFKSSTESNTSSLRDLVANTFFTTIVGFQWFVTLSSLMCVCLLCSREWTRTKWNKKKLPTPIQHVYT